MSNTPLDPETRKTIEERRRKMEGASCSYTRSDRNFNIAKKILEALAVLLVLSSVGYAIWKGTSKKDDVPEKGEQLKPTKFLDDGSLMMGKNGEVLDPKTAPKKGTRVLSIFDPQCPACGAIDRSIGDHLFELNSKDEIALYLTPFSFLNSQSSDDYSQRAVSALVTVVENDPAHAKDFMREMFKENNQPKELQNYVPVSEDQMVKWAKDAGVASDAAEKIKNRSYMDWAMEHSQKLETREDLFPEGKIGTPNIQIGGKMANGKLEGATKYVPQNADLISDFDAQLKKVQSTEGSK